MKSIFFKRLGACLLDVIIVSILTSIITMGFKNSNSVTEEMNELLEKMANGEVTSEEYSEQIFELNYEYQRSIVPTTVVNVVVCFGYFVIFGCLNKGQTFGKKIFKIKIVNKENKDPSILNMLGRNIFLYSILTGLINVISVYIFNVKTFNYINNISNYISYGFVIICMFMIMNRKDGRGLHDMMGGTTVREVK